ncbi:hypothetical protein [Agrobacterium salinitolerans]|uniref:hypothetical protein n=1 Tax=Agrobacterium salinitolerans TaxID=1183413 RepID=UPI001AED9D14|nr:hypothetical protein [Agrobacterium salinitolerans]NTA36825.1 DUF551 domain-containing protein [Agrobacterium salinitolerans]
MAVKTPFEVASKHIPEARVSLLSRAIRQGLNDYGWKNFGTLPEVLMGYIVHAEKAEADAHPQSPRDCGHDGGDLSERQDNIGSAYTRSALTAQVQDVAGWQPIETAPKDGSAFLAVMAKAYSPRATLCKFQDGKFLSPSQGEKFVLPGWNQWWPTHWMPLPAAPAKQEGCTNE